MFPWPIENNNSRLIICCTLIEKGLVEQFNLKGKKYVLTSPNLFQRCVPETNKGPWRSFLPRYRPANVMWDTDVSSTHAAAQRAALGTCWSTPASGGLWPVAARCRREAGVQTTFLTASTRALGSSFVCIYLFWLNEYAYFKTCFIAQDLFMLRHKNTHQKKKPHPFLMGTTEICI